MQQAAHRGSLTHRCAVPLLPQAGEGCYQPAIRFLLKLCNLQVWPSSPGMVRNLIRTARRLPHQRVRPGAPEAKPQQRSPSPIRLLPRRTPPGSTAGHRKEVRQSCASGPSKQPHRRLRLRPRSLVSATTRGTADPARSHPMPAVCQTHVYAAPRKATRCRRVQAPPETERSRRMPQPTQFRSVSRALPLLQSVHCLGMTHRLLGVEPPHHLFGERQYHFGINSRPYHELVRPWVRREGHIELHPGRAL